MGPREVDWFSKLAEECGKMSDNDGTWMNHQQRSTRICHKGAE